jgi:hypothetical protein
MMVFMFVLSFQTPGTLASAQNDEIIDSIPGFLHEEIEGSTISDWGGGPAAADDPRILLAEASALEEGQDAGSEGSDANGWDGDPDMPDVEDFELAEEQVVEDIDKDIQLPAEEDGTTAPAESESGSISGLLWEDDDGTPLTEWDRLYNFNEQPDHIIIPIGENDPMDNGIYTGYTLYDDRPYRTLAFDTAANFHTYEITQSGDLEYWLIIVADGVNTTITLNGIDGHFSRGIELKGNAKVNLLLKGTNTMDTGHIIVPADAALTIDSASGPGAGSKDGVLTINAGNLGAGIGSIGGYMFGSNSGQITINGGTVNVTQNGTGNAAIGGGAGMAGNVTINGGKVDATAFSGGAAIGGGLGERGTGNVIINGGTVNAKTSEAGKSGAGAGIGGGMGGDGNVTIKGGFITAESAEGAGIGSGGANTEGTSIGKVTVFGGTINVNSLCGAAIGGGGSASGKYYGIADVEVFGGGLNLKSYEGACIGNSGSQHNIEGAGLKGSVTINGGTVFADFNKGNAIGSGYNNKNVPIINIDQKADIVGFGRSPSNFPGINCGDGEAAYENGVNKGNGYFVNGNFDRDKGGSDGLMIIYNKNDLINPVRLIPIPFKFSLFSFTTGLTDPQDYYIYTGTFSGGLRQIIRTADEKPEIYSVKRPWDYHDNKHTYDNFYRSLSVKYGDEAEYPNCFLITERLVDINGQPLMDDDYGYELIAEGMAYSKNIPAIPGYTVKGYKVGPIPPSGKDTFTEGATASIPSVTASVTMYFVYAPYSETDITVSKTVKGAFADRTKDFNFTISFYDSDNKPLAEGKEFAYVGGATAGTAPIDGTLTLNAEGEAVFTLRHEQAITIKGVPSDAMIQIEEKIDGYYTVSVIDSLDKSNPKENPVSAITVGDQPRTFAFENTRTTIVPTGIDGGSWVPIATLISATLLLLAVMIATELTDKRRKSIPGKL